MRFLLGTFVRVGVRLFAQSTNAPSDAVPAIVGRLEAERYKAHIKGLSQFGDRMQGTQRNRDAIDWIEKQLRSFGYSNVERHRFMSVSGPLEISTPPRSERPYPEKCTSSRRTWTAVAAVRQRTTTHPAARWCSNWLAFWECPTYERIAR